MSNQSPAIGFIGIGTLGRGLALAMAQRGYRIVAAASRSYASTQWLAQRINGCHAVQSAQEVAQLADVVFITTPDSVISTIAAQTAWRPGQGVVHCCGAESIDILRPASNRGAVAGAFHPFQTFGNLSDPSEAVSRLSGVTFAVAGQGWLLAFLQQLVSRLEGRAVQIQDTDRPLYHSSAVLGCGYLATLLQNAIDIWQKMGFSHQEALDAIYPIARTTLENVRRTGPAASVTGPTVRGDVETVERHLKALAQRMPELLPLYHSLTIASLPLAAQRNANPEALAEMRHRAREYLCQQTYQNGGLENA